MFVCPDLIACALKLIFESFATSFHSVKELRLTFLFASLSPSLSNVSAKINDFHIRAVSITKFFLLFLLYICISARKKLFMKQIFPLFFPFFRIFWPFLLTFFTPKIILLEVFLRFVAKSRLFYPHFPLIHFSVGMTIFASSLDKKLLAVFSTDFHPQKLQYLYIQYF
mgnify:FL=1